ncbi:uncharacterized protein [Dermacentor albipictus]|uniref:uncharacterized protein isoform X2 n=1 Tax=Dermacentor albipictus TaxID=60249 RepID=UPI0031FBBCB8
MLHETLHESNQPTERASRRPRPLQPLCSPSRVPGCEGTPAQDVNGAVMTSADQRRCASDVVETARSGRRPTEFPSGCVGATRSAAGLLATSSSASATMTPRRAALWDPHAALPGNSNVLPCFWFRHERLRSCRVMRASTNQLSLRLPGRHKDCSRSPGHVFQRKCHHDAISGCTLGSAGAAGGHSSILPCFWLRYASPCPCRVLCPDLPACWPSATLRWLPNAGESHAAAAPRAARSSPGASLDAAVSPPAVQCCQTRSRGLLFL